MSTADDAGFVEPAYGSRSLADVVPAVAAALGIGDSPLELPGAPSYVVFLVDGLGARLLQRHAHAAPYLSSLVRDDSVGTAGVPSTTATSLTSLGTGLPPGAHGLVGFTSRIPGTTRLLNALYWPQDVDPLEWQPHPTALGDLTRSGVAVTVVNKREFAKSGLTIATTRGTEYVGADKVGERIAVAMRAAGRTPSLTYLYDSDLDWTGHRYGVASQQWLQQLAAIDSQIEQLRESLPPSTRLLVVADHGMVDAGADDRIDVDEHPQLRDGVALLGGEARFRHVYCRSGACDDVATTWAETLGERALVLTRQQAIERGWFGTVDASVLPRLGDVVVAATGTTALMSSKDFGYEMSLIGLHGSLTPTEMLIPLLVD